MGLLNSIRRWIGVQTRFRRHEDAYTLDREALWVALQSAIERQRQLQHSVWLVVHFPSTFEQVQDQLEAWGLPYEVITDSIAGTDWAVSELRKPGSIHLILSSLIPLPSDGLDPIIQEGATSVMVLERHPWLPIDEQVESFCRSCPFPLEYGMFLALDDPVLRDVVNETTVMILEQLGMGRHDLIASNMVSRRLTSYLKKRNQSIREPQAADSPEQWLELHWYGERDSSASED